MILHSHILYNSNIIIYENFLSQYMVLHFTLSFLQSHKAIFHTWLDRFNSDICISFIFQELHQGIHLPAGVSTDKHWPERIKAMRSQREASSI